MKLLSNQNIQESRISITLNVSEGCARSDELSFGVGKCGFVPWTYPGCWLGVSQPSLLVCINAWVHFELKKVQVLHMNVMHLKK